MMTADTQRGTVTGTVLLLSKTETAKALGISTRSLERLADLPSVKLGSRRLWKLADLARYIDALPDSTTADRENADQACRVHPNRRMESPEDAPATEKKVQSAETR